jgi:hypothetical protein
VAQIVVVPTSAQHDYADLRVMPISA